MIGLKKDRKQNANCRAQLQRTKKKKIWNTRYILYHDITLPIILSEILRINDNYDDLKLAIRQQQHIIFR